MIDNEERCNNEIGCKNASKTLLIALLISLVSVPVVFFASLEYPDTQLWGAIDKEIILFGLHYSLFKLFHLITGFIIFVYGIFHSIIIIQINSAAQASKNNPSELLTTGYYGKARNPMITMFIISTMAFFFMICSYMGLILSVLLSLFLAALCLYEEKHYLIPQFGNEYENYKKKVPNRFLFGIPKFLILFLLFFSIIGTIF